ncbi:MAG: hypothetical protein ACLT40_01355 [Fusobacterium sp.]
MIYKNRLEDLRKLIGKNIDGLFVRAGLLTLKKSFTVKDHLKDTVTSDEIMHREYEIKFEDLDIPFIIETKQKFYMENGKPVFSTEKISNVTLKEDNTVLASLKQNVFFCAKDIEDLRKRMDFKIHALVNTMKEIVIRKRSDYKKLTEKEIATEILPHILDGYENKDLKWFLQTVNNRNVKKHIIEDLLKALHGQDINEEIKDEGIEY